MLKGMGFQDPLNTSVANPPFFLGIRKGAPLNKQVNLKKIVKNKDEIKTSLSEIDHLLNSNKNIDKNYIEKRIKSRLELNSVIRC
ncbi:MAG: hypothetical protein KGH65_01100 [Candidatus Micrarchaeota archaeon]|nr:hypothetical protein [Candidatus Micrarchaeota archaeon]